MYEFQYKYEKTDKGKKSREKYRQNKKGKEMRKKSMDKCYLRDKEILKRLKINGCAICGYNECVAALEFHHVNSKSKVFPVNLTGVKRRNESVANEVNKCILLCANCHRKIHYEELD